MQQAKTGSAQGLAARQAAQRLLHAVLGERRMLGEVTEAGHGPLAHLPPSERARAQSIALGVLRRLDALDAVLATFAERRPPERILNILRIAAWEMLADGAAPHGAVNAAVALTRRAPKGAPFTGLVNAVLRRVAEGGLEIWADQPVQALPSWLAKPVTTQFGRDAVATIAAAHAAGAPLDLTLAVGLDPADWADRLGATVLPTGSLRLMAPGQVSALPGFDEGAWWVQDAAAAIPARMLGDVAGQRVLDLCAAPGGKTMQLAAAGATVTALDLSESRLARLRENLQRTGLTADVVAADALTWASIAPFDAILLDAPCSATGTIRRHPDLPHARAGADMSALFDLQARLIDRALDLLRPGGRLVYCTCSLLAREGERQAADAMARHPDLKAIRPDAVAGIDPAWIDAAGGLRLRPDFWPDLGGMDGFYAIALHKP
jgi:16S rRNA (cytosine967-C5)-methyltransferase